jgi:hypothetical protein
MAHDEIVKQVGTCEYQKVFVDERYDRNYIYLGNLAKCHGVTELRLSMQNKETQ